VDLKNLHRRVEYPDVKGRPAPPKATRDEVKFELQLTFGQELVFACLVEGKVVASAELLYS
jgi:hypothetical protein